MQKLVNWVAVLVAAAVLLVGCGLAPVEERTGALEVIVDAGALVKNFLPPINMVCASYDITVTDSSAVVVISGNITEDTTYDGLLADTYTVDLVGLNDTGFAIGGGSNTVELVVAQVTPCPVTVVEYAGLGTLQVTASWTPDVIAAPVIESELTYGGGSPADISADWIPGADSAALDKGSLAQGWYALVFRLFETGAPDPLAGFATLARIVKDQTTTGTVALVPNAATGGFEVLIDLDFYDPLELGADVPEGAVTLNTYEPAQTINVSGADVYAWYVNGAPVASTASLDLSPADYVVDDTYRVDCLGFSADGKHAGQLTWTVANEGPIQYPISVLVTWTGTAGNMYIFQARWNTTDFQQWDTIGVAGPNAWNLPLPVAATYTFMLQNVEGSVIEWWEESSTQATATPVDMVEGPPVTLAFGSVGP